MMETVTVAEVVVTAERPMPAGGQREGGELRPRRGSAGSPIRLWPAPGNRGHMTNRVRRQMFIYRPRRNQEALL